ncbi:MAG: hypothetical protein ACE5JP_14930, partial [Candidatus Bipolaricaulia bacterium]
MRGGSQGGTGLLDSGAVSGDIEQDGEEFGRSIVSIWGPGQVNMLLQSDQGVAEDLRSGQGRSWGLARWSRLWYA